MKGVVMQGDATTHGGKVTGASGTLTIGGRKVARVGDVCSCPMPGHGVTTIEEGDDAFLLGGAAVAFHGSRTRCGATLIASGPPLRKG